MFAVEHQFGEVDRGEAAFVHLGCLDADVAPDQPQAWRDLDVAILQELILDRALNSFKSDGFEISYTPDGNLARTQVQSGQADAAFLLQSTPVAAVESVANAPASMPHKSTYFYPKLATGMILKPVE